MKARVIFLKVRNVKNYNNRREIHNSKKLLRFVEDSVDFLNKQFLPDQIETRGEVFSPREKMEILLRFVGDRGFQSGIANDEISNNSL